MLGIPVQIENVLNVIQNVEFQLQISVMNICFEL